MNRLTRFAEACAVLLALFALYAAAWVFTRQPSSKFRRAQRLKATAADSRPPAQEEPS